MLKWFGKQMAMGADCFGQLKDCRMVQAALAEATNFSTSRQKWASGYALKCSIIQLFNPQKLPICPNKKHIVLIIDN